jgi:sulfonate transport system permease protein
MFVVAAELIGAGQGLGFLLDYGRNISRTDMIIASIILFAVFGKASDAILVLVEKKALAWRDTAREAT